MDRKTSWPWKKKSSSKAAAAAAAEQVSDSATTHSDPLGSQSEQTKQEESKKPKYVQISVETYSHLTGLEDQVKSYEEQVMTLEEEIKDLKEELLESQSEITNKETLVKQHAKVAEEAVSGWEKAEAEAAALKTHLESVTLLKLTAEDRASHLDSALKECMRQIRNLKEEHEQELHDVMFSNTKHLDEVKWEFESRIATLDQELRRSDAENSSLSRSLHDCSNMLMKLNEEKSQAEAEIEHLKCTIECNQKEINSLKYEVHIVTKEMEIRNEEKNMSVRSAEVANKQHLEGVKKIARLEAECQRLRGLVRKKLPGPAALAQMKLEVENLGRDQSDTRFRRSPVKPPIHHPPPLPELDVVQNHHKENDLLTERLLAMEEETKMLKEALAKRNSELQASRSICAKTASKLQILEAQFQSNGDHRSPPKLNLNPSHPPSLTSFSVDASDDEVSCAGSWATPSVSELSYFKNEKKGEISDMSENTNRLELMDDFLEMEKLANQSNGDINSTSTEVVNTEGSEPKENRISAINDIPEPNSLKEVDPSLKLQVSLSGVINSLSKDRDINKALEDLRCIVDERYGKSNHQSVSCTDEGSLSINPELGTAVSQIHEFVLVLGEEAKAVQPTSFDSEGLSRLMERLSTTYDEFMCKKSNLVQFVDDLSHLIRKANELHFKVMGYRVSEAEASNSDCIDKVALPETKPGSSSYIYPNSSSSHLSDTNSDPDIPHEINPARISESPVSLWKCSFEEFEQLKSEKEGLVIDLNSTKIQLQETEQRLAEIKSQLTSAQKSNGLSETQLKCMAESYNTLETRCEVLQSEVNLLQAKVSSLESELEEERRRVQETLSKCKDLEEQLNRIESCPPVDLEAHNQERELASASEKLAECQETIFLLGKQLNALRPQTEFHASSPSYSERSKKDEDEDDEEGLFYNEPPSMKWEDMDQGDTQKPRRASSSSSSPVHNNNNVYDNNTPLSLYTTPDSKQHHTPRQGYNSNSNNTKSTSSSSSSPTPEKHSRGLSRFFSTRTKN